MQSVWCGAVGGFNLWSRSFLGLSIGQMRGECSGVMVAAVDCGVWRVIN
jgi:hypothetical protein